MSKSMIRKWDGVVYGPVCNVYKNVKNNTIPRKGINFIKENKFKKTTNIKKIIILSG